MQMIHSCTCHHISGDVLKCMKKINRCVGKIKEWMRKHILKLNDEKTEALIIFTDRLHEIHIRIVDASQQITLV